MRTNACPTGPTTRYAAARQPSDTVTTVADQERPGTAAAPTAEHGRLGLALILVAAFMVVLDFSIVNVALSSIQRELGVSAATVQWVVTGYAIAFGGLLILGGRAGDLYGRRRLFLAGIAVFTAASLAAWTRPRPGTADRLPRGAGERGRDGRARRTVTHHHGLPRRPAPHQGAGPVRRHRLGRLRRLPSARRRTGGVPHLALGVPGERPRGAGRPAARPRTLRESRSPRTGRHLDASGALLITLAVGALVFAVSRGGGTGIGSADVLVPLALSTLAAAAFIANEHHHADPLMQ